MRILSLEAKHKNLMLERMKLENLMLERIKLENLILGGKNLRILSLEAGAWSGKPAKDDLLHPALNNH